MSGKFLYGRCMPLAVDNFFVTRMPTRDLFVVTNFLVASSQPAMQKLLRVFLLLYKCT